jgi:endoglucanase
MFRTFDNPCGCRVKIFQVVKLYRYVFFILLGITGGSVSAQNEGFLRADGKMIVNGRGENVILRGIGLGGWMVQEGYMLHLQHEGQQYRIRERIETLLGSAQTQEFYTAWLSNHTTEADIAALHKWGFNSVRLPMHFNLFTLSIDQEPVPGKNTWLKTGFLLTDSLVSWCKRYHMYVILDLHAAPGGQGNDLNISDRDPSKPSLWQSRENKEKTIALWKKIAERYANEPTVGAYDILNEPNWGFEDSLKDRNGLGEKKNIPLKELMEEITYAIRGVDTNHIIIIEGNGWGNNYNGILPTWDKNMVLSFHKYWNQNDRKSIQHILDFRNTYNVPVWLGESGENSNTWFTEAIRLLEFNNIGWSWWPLKKLGNNNPLQVKSNPDYDSLVSYWNGKAKNPPPVKNAYAGLMELASATKFENNIIHRDVIDAMIRQPFSDATISFQPNKISSVTIIPAVDYDLGVNGAAYYDLDTANYRLSSPKDSIGNRGRTYRNDGVDIYEDPARPGDFYVGHIENGEWLQYTIDILKGGKYKLEMTVSTDTTGGLVSVLDNTTPLGQRLQVPFTGSHLNRKKIIVQAISLSKGKHQLRIRADQGGFNFYQLAFYYSGS